mmetsp:Transcript_84210/g.238610  ORF Transcript_84210/g.238610 Transcript_84210/m.238610 type:complete len:223 (+) Transcript_84210:612-1280(+)
MFARAILSSAAASSGPRSEPRSTWSRASWLAPLSRAAREAEAWAGAAPGASGGSGGSVASRSCARNCASPGSSSTARSGQRRDACTTFPRKSAIIWVCGRCMTPPQSTAICFTRLFSSKTYVSLASALPGQSVRLESTCSSCWHVSSGATDASASAHSGCSGRSQSATTAYTSAAEGTPRRRLWWCCRRATGYAYCPASGGIGGVGASARCRIRRARSSSKG